MPSHAVVVIDPEGAIQAWSPGATRLFGYEAADMLGKPIETIIPAEYHERHRQGYFGAIESGEPQNDRPAAYIPVVCRDSSVTHFPGRLYFLKDALDRPAGAMGLFTDPLPEGEGPPLYRF